MAAPVMCDRRPFHELRREMSVRAGLLRPRRRVLDTIRPPKRYDVGQGEQLELPLTPRAKRIPNDGDRR
jgi:hypothetical protein